MTMNEQVAIAGAGISGLTAALRLVERGYQVVTFEERTLSSEEDAAWEPALKLGAEGRRLLRNEPLEHYLYQLSEVRQRTLDALAARDDAWLEQPLSAAPKMNAHFAWFHVAEDEINHRGQIRWLRARLPKRAHPGAAA